MVPDSSSSYIHASDTFQNDVGNSLIGFQNTHNTIQQKEARRHLLEVNWGVLEGVKVLPACHPLTQALNPLMILSTVDMPAINPFTSLKRNLKSLARNPHWGLPGVQVSSPWLPAAGGEVWGRLPYGAGAPISPKTPSSSVDPNGSFLTLGSYIGVLIGGVLFGDPC